MERNFKSTFGTFGQEIRGSRGLPYAVLVHKFQAKAPAGADQRDSGYRRPGVPVVSAAAPASGPRADTKAPCDASWSGILNRDRRCKSIENPACDLSRRFHFAIDETIGKAGTKNRRCFFFSSKSRRRRGQSERKKKITLAFSKSTPCPLPR